MLRIQDIRKHTFYICIINITLIITNIKRYDTLHTKKQAAGQIKLKRHCLIIINIINSRSESLTSSFVWATMNIDDDVPT